MLRVAVGGGAFPDDFVPEVSWSEHRIAHELEVVARGRVAVQIEARVLAHDAPALLEALGHVREVGEHSALAQDGLKAGEGAMRPAPRGSRCCRHSGSRGLVPVPRVGKGSHLGGDAVPAAVQDVVVRFRVERRVEVNEVDALCGPPSQHVETIAVIESVRREVEFCRHRFVLRRGQLEG